MHKLSSYVEVSKLLFREGADLGSQLSVILGAVSGVLGISHWSRALGPDEPAVGVCRCLGVPVEHSDLRQTWRADHSAIAPYP